MPRILITGIPAATHPEVLRQLLTLDVPMAVQNVEGFRISREHVYAHALPDPLERQAVVVMFAIDGLIAKPDRTAKLRQALCSAVADAIASYLERTDTRYASIIGWCAQIHREDDGFVRKIGPASRLQPN